MDCIDEELTALRTELVPLYVVAGCKRALTDIFHDLGSKWRLAGFEVHERFHEIGTPDDQGEFGARTGAYHPYT